MSRYVVFVAGTLALLMLGLGASREAARDETTTVIDPWQARLTSMSTEEKVGQLFLLGFEGADVAGADPALGELRAGGIALLANASQADAARSLTAALHSLAQERGRLAPIIAIDHEGGAVQRIKQGITVFGPAFEVGQIESLERAIAEADRRGATHGRELAAMGIQMSLGPVLDVWDNPANEVIGSRSFSRSPATAAALGEAYLAALQAEGVLAVGKHFPGHGNSLEDSHLTLPVVRRDRATLEAIELAPFRSAIQAGVAAIMTAHVSYPALDTIADRPASLSPAIVTDLLRQNLGFGGLIVSDDMGAMEAITARFEPGEAAVQAIEAGTDMLIVVGPLSRQRRMVQAVFGEVGRRITPERLDDSVRRVLEAKRRAGLLVA
jgi:beta-N-acetylhexosaminidase